MGLFDDIRCEYPLPLPEDQGELAGKDWSKHGFQTKDLGKGMGRYCIRSDGTLWLVGARWLEDDLVGENFQKDFFGSVEFYGTVYGQKHDYRVRWQVTIAEGKLKDLRLSEWLLEDNIERLGQKVEWDAKQARTDRFLKTWMGRFVYPPYAWLVGFLLGEVVGSGAYKLSRVFEKVHTGAWGLGNHLRPHGDPIGARLRRRKMNNRL